MNKILSSVTLCVLMISCANPVIQEYPKATPTAAPVETAKPTPAAISYSSIEGMVRITGSEPFTQATVTYAGKVFLLLPEGIASSLGTDAYVLKGRMGTKSTMGYYPSHDYTFTVDTYRPLF